MHHLLLPMSSRDRRAFGTICPSALLTTTQMTSLHSSLWNAPVIPTSVKLGHQLGGAIISGSGEPCVVQPVHDRNHPRGPTLHDFSQPQTRVPSTHYIGGPSQLSLDDTHSPSRLFLRTHAHSQPMGPRACPLQSLSLADDFPAHFPASSHVTTQLGKTFFYNERRLTAFRAPRSPLNRQAQSWPRRSQAFSEMRKSHRYSTADNDRDIHEYVNVLCFIKLHAFRPLSTTMFFSSLVHLN